MFIYLDSDKSQTLTLKEFETKSSIVKFPRNVKSELTKELKKLNDKKITIDVYIEV